MATNTSISTTVACDYFPPLPIWGLGSNPYRAFSALKETANIAYKMSILMTKMANRSNDPEYQVYIRRADKISDCSFATILACAFSLHAWQIIKDQKLVKSPSYCNDSSIQAITEDVKQVATKALEEYFECHQRLTFGGTLKQYYGVVLNPNLDESKYFWIREDAGEVKSNLDGFNYMVKIAPQELTKNMRALVKRGCEASNRLEDIKERGHQRLWKFSLQVVNDLVEAFLQKNNGASSNRAPASYPYNLPHFKYLDWKIEKEHRKSIVEDSFKYHLPVFKELKESIEQYELEHGEIVI